MKITEYGLCIMGYGIRDMKILLTIKCSDAVMRRCCDAALIWPCQAISDLTRRGGQKDRSAERQRNEEKRKKKISEIQMIE